MKKLDLANEKISKLLMTFAVPCVISMLVAALYNIVDQIFIGWSPAGAYGNAATNVVYPFTVISLAFALLIGDGAAGVFSISKGAKDDETGNSSIGNGIVLLFITSLVLMMLGLIFGTNIIKIFGASKNEIEMFTYAKDYMRIICIGIPFFIMGQGINASIRCDGSPKYAMFTTVIGCVANIILDPIFIFSFGMGVKGAAIATVIGQGLTFIMSTFYFTRTRLIKLSQKSFLLKSNICSRMLGIGLASFITQLAIVIIMSVANNLIATYGYNTMASTGVPYGIVIPLAVIGICMKVFGIVISIVIGIALGGQPIIGYNIGAGNVNRVKETIKYIIVSNLIVGTIAFIAFEFAPMSIINIFGAKNSVEYIEYAKICMQVFLGGIILTCFIKTSSILLQSMGKSKKSTLLALSRDVIFFVPTIIMLAKISGSVVIMLWSAIISDVCSTIVAIIMLKSEIRNLHSEVDNYIDVNIDENKVQLEKTLDTDIIITISREYGSGGRFVAKLLSKELGIKMYDKEIIGKVAEKSGYTENYVAKNEEQNISLNNYYLEDDNIFALESKTIKDISLNRPCIIVGRCANYILRNEKNMLKVFLYSDEKDKINRCVKYYNINESTAKNEIENINKQRAKHYKHFTGFNWYDLNQYDMSFNVDKIGVEKVVDILKKYIVNKNSTQIPKNSHINS